MNTSIIVAYYVGLFLGVLFGWASGSALSNAPRKKENN